MLEKLLMFPKLRPRLGPPGPSLVFASFPGSPRAAGVDSGPLARLVLGVVQME